MVIRAILIIEKVDMLWMSKNSWHTGEFCKDAGFVYKSLRIETNRVIWDFCFHETNPQNESFKNRPTNQIHETNL